MVHKCQVKCRNTCQIDAKSVCLLAPAGRKFAKDVEGDGPAVLSAFGLGFVNAGTAVQNPVLYTS